MTAKSFVFSRLEEIFGRYRYRVTTDPVPLVQILFLPTFAFRTSFGSSATTNVLETKSNKGNTVTVKV